MSNVLIQDSEFPQIIREYESGIAKGEDTFNLTLNTLRKINEYGKTKGSLLRREVPEYQLHHWYTRLAAALSTFAATPLTIDNSMLYSMAKRKPEIVYVFAASGYRGTAHLIHICAKASKDNNFEYDRNTLLLMLSMLSINDLPPEMLQAAANLPPEQYFALSMSWLSERAVITEQGENNRTYLIETSEKYSNIDIDVHALPSLTKVWMYCTYADTPNKHKIKIKLNKLILKFLEKTVNPSPVAYIKKKKPTVLVIHEYFQRNHAMYRCYAPFLRSLKEDFNLIAFADEKVIDKKDRDIFDYIKAGKYDEMPFAKLVEIISKIKPDIIYYPSVGMRWWVLMLANLRLAPIQIASLGHPATTQSEAIDYIFTGFQEGNLNEIYSERTLTTPQFYTADAHPLQKEVLDLIKSETPQANRNKINIAINAKVMKLSYRMLNICKRLCQNTEKEIIFHFFPGEIGIFDDGIRANLRKELPNCIVYTSANYPDFMRNLSNCDISLAAFPFGNTNSTVDACVLRLPVVAHFGAEMSAQSDRLVMRSARYPEWMITYNDEDYYQTAKRLVDEYFSGFDIKAHLFESASPDEINGENATATTYIRDLFVHLYNNYHALKASEVKSIDWSDIQRNSN